MRAIASVDARANSGWNASWCYVHGGTARDRSSVSLFATETRIWFERKLTVDTRMWTELQINEQDEG